MSNVDFDKMASRFPKMAEQSPEMFEGPKPEPPPLHDPEADYLAQHPEFARLEKLPATSDRRPESLETIKKLRVDYFRQQTAKQQHDLTPEEIEFAAEVLALRIEGKASIKELIRDMRGDLYKDFNALVSDVNECRRRNQRNAELGRRYPKMYTEPLTARQYFFGGMDPGPKKKA